jgi:two-component system CheB/CheR fusion protein
LKPLDKTMTDASTSSATITDDSGRFVVCLGASAGGLDALERFFKSCPPDTGATFVVIQHLSPDHKSMMSNLLARHTTMPVTMVEDEMVMAPNHVYLIPPGQVMHVSPNHLHLTPKNPRGLTLPIDIFFASLASVYNKKAVAVILSGTGTDGTRGATAIHDAGGIVMAQEPESAKFDGMPRSVINTGIVNSVLPVEDLPARILAHLNNLPVPAIPADHELQDVELTADEAKQEILRRLHQHSGINFEEYKQATVMRRIERRMNVRHTPHYQDYLRLLDSERAELLALRREMLIPVTSFFRDPETFETLADKVIEPLVAERQTGESIRVWIAGVASGEEAYTIAMLFLEAFEKQRRWPMLKIFATDVDQQCVEIAGVGHYPESSATELSTERIDRFFNRRDNGITVKSELRQCIVFARHNLLSDPPFTKMDLVVCRNTLIYFKSAAQDRALRALHYALKLGGAMLLGSSESLTNSSEGLQTVSQKHKIFRCISLLNLPLLEGSRKDFTLTTASSSRVGPVRLRRRTNEPAATDEAVATLLQRYAPPSILVNPMQEMVHLYGDAKLYIMPRPGAVSLDVTKLLPEPLMPVVSAMLYKVGTDGISLQSDPVRVQLGDGREHRVRVSVHPVLRDGQEPLSLVCFEAQETTETHSSGSIDVEAETMAHVAALERELRVTRENLQATIEELETSNEELQATNEELMASNEELQSSNEELQSVNEEMGSVNAEFQEKMTLLNKANADLDNMAKASGVPTVFVDDKLEITRFSPDAKQVFKVRDSDVGRRLDDITHMLRYPGLMEDLSLTLQTGRMIEREVRTTDDTRTYLVRMLPYVMHSTLGTGAVITLVDITELLNAQRLQVIIDALPENIAVLDQHGTILMVNAAWNRFALDNGGDPNNGLGVGCNYLQACTGKPAESLDAQGEEVDINFKLQRVLEGVSPSFTTEYPCHSPDKQRWFVMSASGIKHPTMRAVVSHFETTMWHHNKH